jgi:hypothetical protein
MPRVPGFRVFLSYSRKNTDLVAKLEKILRKNGVATMRDKHFAYGVGFQEQIRRYIEFAHVFVPVITKKSSKRGWVQQEIGYAIAQNVPVLPVAIDWKPQQWLRNLHSVMLNKKRLDKDRKTLRALFSRELFRELVHRYRKHRFAVYACAMLQEDRAEMMADYADEVASIQSLVRPPKTKRRSKKFRAEPPMSSRVRQKGALSSFHIPAEPVNSPVWEERFGRVTKSEHHCRLLRAERLSLTRHAAEWGARLIIDPSIPYTQLGPKVRAARLKGLLRYLYSKEGRKTQVVFNTRMARAENVTIVGSWFMATAAAAEAGKGYYQTIFTRHAASIHARIDEFDDEFERLLIENDAPKGMLEKNSMRGLSPKKLANAACGKSLKDLAKASRKKAIEELERMVREEEARYYMDEPDLAD